ncbi:MAG: hypothetical protein FJX23_10210 [Alphaproteobacteria bacterium]|nr:hypothetical protein [Alphaproteobacteria bacterium]
MNTLKKVLFLSVAFLGLSFVAACDEPTTGEKVDNAVEDLQEGRGVGEAAEELQDRTTGEKIGDAIEDAGQDVQDAAKDAAE